MAKYRTRLPQMRGTTVLTDGGLETFMIFQEGVALPHFASFDLMRSADGRDRLRAYYMRYVEIAWQAGTGLLLESPTWRASIEWGALLDQTADGIAGINRQAVALLAELRAAHETNETPMVISGCVGPRGDGYDSAALMTPAQAQDFHTHQIIALADTDADLITALTMTNTEEAIGVTRAAQSAGIPVAISFKVETDGRLPTGQELGDAIAAVDAATEKAPAYFMINDAHPTHIEHVLAGNDRVMGLRAGASRRSQEELDNAEELDKGDPVELGAQFADLVHHNPRLTVLGGGYGTDHRHIGEIARAVRDVT